MNKIYGTVRLPQNASVSKRFCDRRERVVFERLNANKYGSEQNISLNKHIVKFGNDYICFFSTHFDCSYSSTVNFKHFSRNFQQLTAVLNYIFILYILTMIIPLLYHIKSGVIGFMIAFYRRVIN